MAMKEHVHIARRFLRSIRIDADLGDAMALEGFVCSQSSSEVLLTMARHVSETRQGAFTWTGPYGSGKSSLVVALSALLNGNAGLQQKATEIFGSKLTTELWRALPTGTEGWRILPVVGRRTHPVLAIGEAMQAAGFAAEPKKGWTEVNLIHEVTKTATANPKSSGGLIIFIDEMGKFLEAAAQENMDIYIFQQLAEAAARIHGRLLIVGVLHQSFEEYAYRISREMRDEWAKIQGRFIDLAISTAGEEQIDLISRAIERDYSPKEPSSLSFAMASLIHRDRTSDAKRFALMLENCWPLHPIVVILLGPISRRRFGQNQRSIFGFLNSAEPNGFQDFLRRADDHALYWPDQLWDYLRANLEPSIFASPDGHRWALATEALERCEAIGGDALHVRLLKIIAIVDLFKERSGIVPSIVLLRTCFVEISQNELETALDWLCSNSFIIYKKFLDAYAIYAGSDFDIDGAVRFELTEIDSIDFGALKELTGLQPILAKRHYHETGALRWFEVNLAPLRNIVEIAGNFQPRNGVVGQFVLVIPTEGENEETAARICRNAARRSNNWDTVVGISMQSWAIMILVRELIALEKVRNNRPELAGDAVARREVTARLSALQGQLESELHKAFDSALWFRKYYPEKAYRHAELNSLASELADYRFSSCPRLHNELLNRQKPSSNAIAAQNILLRRMVLNEGEHRLGIQGFPAEGGLFVSVLEATDLYTKKADKWCFAPPVDDAPSRLTPIWDEATEFIKNNCDRTIAVSEIYDRWRAQPYGLKDGLMPILMVAFILSQRNNIAVYREGIFRAHFDDVDVEYLAKNSTTIQLRWMDLSDVARRLLSSMAEIVRKLDQTNTLAHLEPIDVARGLVGIYEQLPPWAKRTMRLSKNAIRVRDLFKRAHDPNQFLFDDIPKVVCASSSPPADIDLEKVIAGLHEGLEELVQAYPSMVHRLRDILLAELQVPNFVPQSLADLRDRAANIRQLAGDFHMEAFVGRLSQFDGSEVAFEGIASLAANKPPRDWVDLDLDRAMVNLADMAQKFLRAEMFARVKGRPEKRHAMAVVISREGRPVPILEEFHVGDADREAINALIDRVAAALEESDTTRRSVILAALAELSARYMADPSNLKIGGQGRAVNKWEA